MTKVELQNLLTANNIPFAANSTNVTLEQLLVANGISLENSQNTTNSPKAKLMLNSELIDLNGFKEVEQYDKTSKRKTYQKKTSIAEALIIAKNFNQFTSINRVFTKNVNAIVLQIDSLATINVYDNELIDGKNNGGQAYVNCTLFVPNGCLCDKRKFETGQSETNENDCETLETISVKLPITNETAKVKKDTKIAVSFKGGFVNLYSVLSEATAKHVKFE